MHNQHNKKYNGILIILITIICIISSYSFASVSAELVDKVVTPKEGPVAFSRGKVKITLSNGNSKILPFTTHFTPLVVGDQIYIITSDKFGRALDIFVYNSNNGQSAKYPLPPDINTPVQRFFCAPSFSPDGHKIAYYYVFPDGQKKVIVRSFPDWKVLKESPPEGLIETDAPYPEPRWQTPQQVEFDEYFFDPPRKVTFTF